MSYRHGRKRTGRGRDMADDSAQVQVEVQNWDSGTATDLIGFLERKTNLRLKNYRVDGSRIVITETPQNAEVLTRYDNHRFAGRYLRIKSLSQPAPSAQASTTMQLLKSILYQRYDANTKLLNFGLMLSDPQLMTAGLLATPQTADKMFQALLKVASDEKLDVESVNLAGNAFANCDVVQHVANAFPRLQNLSLADNSLPSLVTLSVLKSKFPYLRELVLAGNPLQQHPAYAGTSDAAAIAAAAANGTLSTTISPQKREIISWFPRLLILDGQQVRSEDELPKFALPVPLKRCFFEDAEVEKVVAHFLQNFIALWDSNRADLGVLYDASSLFSLCFSGQTPHVPEPQGTHTSNSAFISCSRNLLKSRTHRVRNNLLRVGQSAILQAFAELPASVHNLPGNEFAIDAWRVQDIRVPGDTAIMMCVHGDFAETSNAHRRSFDRSFVVLPGAAGYLIASDMLTVRPQSQPPVPDQAQVSQTVPQPQPQLQPQPQPQPQNPTVAGQPSIQPGMPGVQQGMQQQGVPGVPGVQPGVQPGVPGMQPSPAQVELIRQTNLKPEFAEMCLKQANYDLQAALQLFQQSRAQLGPDAFN